jgi:cation diffusion facilitator CzcD-associated flavoprotein CzcO
VVDHIERSASGLDIRFKTTVERIDRGLGGWLLRTSAGDIKARQVIVATGYDHTPHVPEWRGMRVHRWRNQSVGGGAHAAQHHAAQRSRRSSRRCDRDSALSLAAAARDRIARRARRHAIGDLTNLGLPIPDQGPFSRSARLGVAPALVEMAVINAIKAEVIEVVKAPESFDGSTVSLLTGKRLQVDVVICATGYRRGLEPLVGHLGVLDIGYTSKRARHIANEIANGLR